MRLFVYLCIVFFVLAGCSLKKPTLSEVLKYEQNTAILTDAPTLLHEESENLKNDFLEKYFSVWDKDYLWISQEDAFFGFELLKNKSKYAVENLIEADDDWTKNIKKLSNFDNYGSNLSYAITTQNTNLRLLPTDKPFFRASSKSFDYPFDRIQNSFISVMQPLMVSHYSTDFAWAFIESGAAAGWVKSNELAIVDKQIIQKIKNASKIVVTKDNAAVYYKEGLFAHYLKAGSILPVHEYKNGLYEAFIINTQKDGNGFIANITVSEEFAAPFPLEFNDENVKTALNELLGENYGWGGLYANRDCSAMTKDFFSLFGIWLPRNSRAQKNAGIYFDISNLTASQKEQKIKELAQPYLTLIFMPGHIMLYTGQMDERALIMHNIWAVTNSKGKKFLIGKSVISDLHIGENLPDVKDRNLLISKIQGFSVLAPKEAKDAIKLLNTYQESISSIKNNLIYFKNGKTLIFDDGKNKTLEEMLQNADVQDQLYETYTKGALDGFPQNDAGRIRNSDFLGELYGSDKNEIKQNLTSVVWLPSYANITLYFNKNNGAAKALQAVSNELDKLDETYLKPLRYPSGTHEYRNIIGTNRLSAHAFGIAIDLDVQNASYWYWDEKTKRSYNNSIPQKIIDIFEKHGFIWGGKWRHYDTMHFEYRPELL